jgi:hypothetical protein
MAIIQGRKYGDFKYCQHIEIEVDGFSKRKRELIVMMILFCIKREGKEEFKLSKVFFSNKIGG